MQKESLNIYSTPIAPVINKSNKAQFILFKILAIASFTIIGILYYQNKQLKQHLDVLQKRSSTNSTTIPITITISKNPTNIPTTASTTPIQWQWYNNSRFGFKLQYPDYWQAQEEYNVDAYARRKKMMEYPEYVGTKVLRFPSDSYSIISLKEPNTVSYEQHSVVYLNIYIYNNPNKLSLDDFFRGYQFEEGWVYPPEDSLTEVRYSKMIQNAQMAQVGNIEGKQLADFEYSDMGGLYKRDYLFSLQTQIIRLDFGFKSYYSRSNMGSVNESVNQKIQKIIDSFRVENM